VGEDLNPRQEDKERLIKEIRGCCYRELGEKAESVDTWLQTFPFTDEVFAPAPSQLLESALPGPFGSRFGPGSERGRCRIVGGVQSGLSGKQTGFGLSVDDSLS